MSERKRGRERKENCKGDRKGERGKEAKAMTKASLDDRHLEQSRRKKE